MSQLGHKVGQFVLGQLMIGFFILLFGGLVAPLFWSKYVALEDNPNSLESKLTGIWLFILWFVVSWGIVLAALFAPGIYGRG